VTSIILSGSFDDLRSRHVRLMHEAARMGPVRLVLWSDQVVERLEGKGPKFPESEREYLLRAIRYVDRLTLCDDLADRDTLPDAACGEAGPNTWVVTSADDTPAKRAFCRARGIEYCVLNNDRLAGFPELSPEEIGPPSGRKKVIVTGCYDWFHSGHVRFFEEVSELGELYVVAGHDANIKLLKGEGHPLFPEQERRYLVQAVRFVKQALVSTGDGWLDAEPEIERLRPDIYAVNEDGDRPEKRKYCEARGIEYRVLKRLPKEGLPKRQSTNLRGF
jgi:cytidyltransferase-like protein